MSALNKKAPKAPAQRTHEGAVASKATAEQTLLRLTSTAMLWEDNFYVDGMTIAQKIAELIPQCDPNFVAATAIRARTDMKLRHMPLFIAREMARGPVAHRTMVRKLLPQIIQRADELTEFLAIYWKDKRQPLSAQVKRGLAEAFPKFNEYNLAKYNRDKAVKLRDVAFLTHTKPVGQVQTGVFARLVNKDTIPTHTKGGHVIDMDGFPRMSASANPGLVTPDTWETELSAGKGVDKSGSWRRLLAENKLGGLAWLRNLRNMGQAGLTKTEIAASAASVNFDRVLPFRFIAAARQVPQFEDMLEPLMLRAAEGQEKLKGKTFLLVDVSGSMQSAISSKSDLIRLDAAKALAMLLREICEGVQIATFDTTTTLVPPRRGTSLGQAVAFANREGYDRIVVLTDEQSMDRPAAPLVPGRGYIINIASHQNGVGYGPWHTINGWSEAVVDYLRVYEAQE